MVGTRENHNFPNGSIEPRPSPNGALRLDRVLRFFGSTPGLATSAPEFNPQIFLFAHLPRRSLGKKVSSRTRKV